MTQLDSEIITWLFIAFAGAAFGVLALHRVFSKKDLPGSAVGKALLPSLAAAGAHFVPPGESGAPESGGPASASEA
ncbi:MAG: DUF389 domain-containing protein [Sutterella seckii]